MIILCTFAPLLSAPGFDLKEIDKQTINSLSGGSQHINRASVEIQIHLQCLKKTTKR